MQREKGNFCFFKWVDCGIVSIGQLWDLMDILLTMNLKQTVRLLTLTALVIKY